MLEAVLPPIFQGRLEDALSRIQSGLGRIIGVENELGKIKRYLRDISGFTVMAEHVARKDEDLMKLLKKLKDAPYDAEDLLEEFEIEDTRRAAEKTNIMRVSGFVPNKVRKVVPSFFNTRGPNLRLKACELSDKLQKIMEECDASPLKQLETEYKKWLKSCRDTCAFVDPSRVFGRDNEINEIMDWLVPTEEPVMGVQAISILGMGGLGKTTLAQSVYAHGKVELHFSLKMWMCVSDGFVVTKLENEIIEGATGSNPNLEGRQKLHNYLKNALHGKKFLLVLDDVRDDAECDEWLKLKDLLMPGDRGSRIVVIRLSLLVSFQPMNT